MRTLVFALVVFVCGIVSAQTSREEVFADINKAGGVYYAYPTPADRSGEIRPAGYTPFYISHFGRHGSRYLISDNDYTWVADLLEKADSANCLSPLGKSVKMRLDSILPVVRGRGGDLSPKGVRQHRGIAERMYRAYPEVFADTTAIIARSTPVVRCVLSMDAFCERLKELNPTLRISRDASRNHIDSLNYHSKESNKFTANDGPWREVYNNLHIDKIKSERLSSSIFSNPDFLASTGKTSDELMWGLYWIAVGQQDIDSDISFLDIFLPEELFDIWQVNNAAFYMKDANYAGNNGVVVANAANYVADIIHHADINIAKGGTGATLRFAHDGNLIPLTAFLKLDNCYESISDPNDFYKVFSDFKIAPMAGNLQIIFFSNDNDPNDILVKFLHNESVTGIPINSDVLPFYHWSDVRAYLNGLLDQNVQ